MDRDTARAPVGAREHAPARAALLSPRYDIAPRPPPGAGGDARRDSGGGILPALAPAVHHPPPAAHAASPNAFKRTGWTTPRSPPAGHEPRFPDIEGRPRPRSRSLLNDTSTGSVDSEPDWSALQPATPAPRRPEGPNDPDSPSPVAAAHPFDTERDQLAYMEQMYHTINALTAELEKERQDRARLEDTATLRRLVTESEYAPVDTPSALTPSLAELEDDAYGVSPMTRSPASPAAASRSYRPSPPQPHQAKRPIGAASTLAAQLPKDQLELCSALGKNAELRIRAREMARTADKSSQELDQAQKQVKLAERRIANREEKLRGLLKEKMHWQKELKDMRDQVVEEKMRQVDIFRRMESLKREHAAQLEEMERTLQDVSAENEELRVHVDELRAHQTYQARRVEELARQAKEEKDNFDASIAETRQRFKEWKENEANALRVAKEQALSNLKTEYELKIVRHQEEKQKLRDKVKDLEVSLKLMQKDRTLSPLELRLRKATILGGRDNGGTSEAELIETHARIHELETLLEHSNEYQRRQENIIKMSEATISRLVQEREVTALENLSAHPLTLSPASVAVDDFSAFAPIGMTGPRSPRDVRKPSQYSGSYDKSKSNSPPRPSRTFPSAMTAAEPASIDGLAGQASLLERKSVRSESLRVSALDAVAPITPVATPKRCAPAPAPSQDIPSPRETPSAKEEYLVNELARLRSELEQVKMRQRLSTVAAPHAAECIDSRVMVNGSNEESADAAAASLEADVNHDSAELYPSPARVTTDLQDGDAVETKKTTIADPRAPDMVEVGAASSEGGEMETSALATALNDDKGEPEDQMKKDAFDRHDSERTTHRLLSGCASGADEAAIYRNKDAEETSTDVSSLKVGEGFDQTESQDAAVDEKPAAVDECVPDAGQGSDHVGGTTNSGATQDGCVLKGLHTEPVRGEYGIEALLASPGLPERALPVGNEAVTCQVECIGADVEQRADIETSGGSGDFQVNVTTSDLALDAADAVDSIGNLQADASIESVADDTSELVTSEGADALTPAANTDNPTQGDSLTDSAQLESEGERNALPYDLVEVADVAGEAQHVKEPPGDEKLSLTHMVDGETANGILDSASNGEVEQPSVPIVGTETLASPLKPIENDPPAPITESNTVSIAAPATLTTPGIVEPADLTTTQVDEQNTFIVADNTAFVIESTVTIATTEPEQLTESEAEVLPKSDTAVDGDLLTTSELEEIRAFKAGETCALVDAFDADTLGEQTVSQASQHDATESGGLCDSQPAAMTAAADECLNFEVMAAVAAVVDQCCANESVLLPATPNVLPDGAVQPPCTMDPDDASTIRYDVNPHCPDSIIASEETHIVTKISELEVLDTVGDKLDLLDSMESAPDTASGPKETLILAESLGAHEDLTGRSDVAQLAAPDNTVVSDASSSSQASSCSQVGGSYHNTTLLVNDPVEESIPLVLLQEIQVASGAVEAEEVGGKPSVFSEASRYDAETVLEIDDAPVFVKAMDDSTTTGSALSSSAAVAHEQLQGESGCVNVGATTTGTQENQLSFDFYRPDHTVCGLRNLAETFCQDVISSAVGEVSIRQPPSTGTSNQDHTPAHSQSNSSILVVEQALREMVEATASGSDSNDHEPARSNSPSTIDATQQRTICPDLNSGDDSDRGEHSLSLVGDSAVSFSCPSMHDQRVECSADTFTFEADDAVCAQIPTCSIGTLETRSLDIPVEAMPLTGPVQEMVPTHIAVGSVETVESTKRMVEPEVDAIMRKMVDNTAAQSVVNASSTAGEAQAVGNDSAGNERCLRVAEVMSELVNEVVRNALIVDNLHDCAEEIKHHTSNGAVTSENSLDDGNDTTDHEHEHAPDRTDDLPRIDADDALMSTQAVLNSNTAWVTDEFENSRSLGAAKSQELPVQIEHIAQELAVGAVARAVASALVSTEIQLNMEQHDSNGGDNETHEEPPLLSEIGNTLEVHAPIEDITRELAAYAVARAMASALVSAEIQLNMTHRDKTEEVEEDLMEVPLLSRSNVVITPVLPAPIEDFAHELAISAVARVTASALVSAEIQLNIDAYPLDKADEDPLTQSSVQSSIEDTPKASVTIEQVTQELAVGAVARAVASALVSAEIHLNMKHHDAGEADEEPIVESSAEPDVVNTLEVSVLKTDIAQELAIGAVARAVASALVSAKINLNMESQDMDMAEDDKAVLVEAPLAVNAEEGAQQHVKILAVAVVNDEIPLHVERSDANDTEIHDDDCDQKEECAVDTTEAIHGSSIAPTSAVNSPDIGERTIWSVAVDPDVAELLKRVCSAIALQLEAPEREHKTHGDAESELQEPAHHVNVGIVSASADTAPWVEVESPTPEGATHRDNLLLRDELPAALYEQVCQIMDAVVTRVCSTTSLSEASGLAGTAALSQDASETTAEPEVFSDQSSSHFADDDAVNDARAPQLTPLESAQPVGETTTLLTSFSLLGDEMGSQSQQPRSINTVDPTASPRGSGLVVFTASESCSEVVHAVLNDVCAHIEQSNSVDQRKSSSNTRSESPVAHRRSSQSVLPTVFERHGPRDGGGSAPTSGVEDRRGSTRRRTKRSGSILTTEQLLAWDIAPSVVDAAESTVKRYASKRRTSRRGLSEPLRLAGPSSGPNPHLLAYDMRNENGEQPFSLLDAEMLRVHVDAHHISQDDDGEVEKASEIIAKRKKMHYEAYCKSMTQRTTPAFNYAPVSIKFEWSDFVVAAPVSPSSRPSPVQKLRLLLKKGERLPCGQYVVVSAFVRPLEDGNENLRVQIYDAERVEEFIFDFLDDHVKKYVAGWSGTDDQAREFVEQLEFRREQGAVIIKLPEKKGLLGAQSRQCRSDNGLAVGSDDGESRLGSTIKLESPEGGEARTPKAHHSRHRVFSIERPATSPELWPVSASQRPELADKKDSGEGRRPTLSAVSDATESSTE